MFYQHLLYLKKCTLLFPPSPLVYGLYACENVNNCERPPNTCINIKNDLPENNGIQDLNIHMILSKRGSLP